MKSKKVTMIAAALVVAVVALAGVGYAAISEYKATTQNSNNTLKSTYITMTQDGDGKYSLASFLTDVYYDSVTNYVNTATSGDPVYEEKTTFTPLCEYAITGSALVKDGDDSDMAKISTDLELTIDSTESGAEKVTLQIDVTKFTKNASLKYTLVILDEEGGIVDFADDTMTTKFSYTEPTATEGGKATWTFTGVDLNTVKDSSNKILTSFTVNMFIGLAANVTSLDTVDSTAGFVNGADGSVFTFTAKVALAQAADPSNP